MTGKAHALARDELVRVLTAYNGTTTSDGAADGTTLIDINLKDNPSISEHAIKEKTILIMSGDAIMEDKGAASFVNATGKIALQGTGFSTQIKVGTLFRILNISSVEIDVADIDTKIGTNTDPAGTTTLFAWLAKIFDAADVAAIEAKLDSPAQGLAAIMATLAAVNAKLVSPATGLAAIMVTLGAISTRLDDPATGLTAIINTLTAHWNEFVDPAHGFEALANTLATTLTDVLAVEGKLDDGTSGLAALKADLDTLLTRLSAAKSSYLNELAAAHMPADLDTLKTRLSDYRAGLLNYLTELGAAHIPADIDTLLARLTAARASNLNYLTELSSAHIPADIDTLKTYCDILDDATNGLANIKSLIDAAEAKLDKLAGSEADTEIAARDLYSGTPSSGAPNVGADILTISTTTRKKIHMLMVSMVNCTAAATVSVRMYTKVNGVEVKFYDQDFTKDSDPDGIMAINGTLAILADLRVEMQSNNASDTSVTVPYSYIMEDME